MTSERAIEILDIIRATYPDINLEYISALEKARRAVQKEIPIKKRRYKDTYFCTSCKTRVRLSDQHCPQCGWKFTMEE